MCTPILWTLVLLRGWKSSNLSHKRHLVTDIHGHSSSSRTHTHFGSNWHSAIWHRKVQILSNFFFLFLEPGLAIRSTLLSIANHIALKPFFTIENQVKIQRCFNVLYSRYTSRGQTFPGQTIAQGESYSCGLWCEMGEFYFCGVNSFNGSQDLAKITLKWARVCVHLTMENFRYAFYCHWGFMCEIYSSVSRVIVVGATENLFFAFQCVCSSPNVFRLNFRGQSIRHDDEILCSWSDFLIIQIKKKKKIKMYVLVSF